MMQIYPTKEIEDLIENAENLNKLQLMVRRTKKHKLNLFSLCEVSKVVNLKEVIHNLYAK